MAGNVLEYLESAARRVPEKTAFADEHSGLRYAELMQAARRVGSALAACCAPRSAVAVVMDHRNVCCVVGMFGALYAGCSYAPLDGAMPTSRLQTILAQLQPAMILYDERTAGAVAQLEGAYPAMAYEAAVAATVDETTLRAIRAQASAYDLVSILYTSGSTGIPKGAAHNHLNYLLYTEATIGRFGFTEADVFGNQSPFFYANSIIDLYPTLALGAATYILPGRSLTFPSVLMEHLNRGRVSELTMTPSSYVQAANAGVLAPGCLPHMRHIILSGEATRYDTLRRWKAAAPNAALWNFYGSTEALSIATWPVDRTFAEGEAIPSGRVFERAHVLLLGEDESEAAQGGTGEILISSPWVSAGYYRDGARTRGVFVNDPLDRGYDERFYRTGDMGYFNEAGQLVVVGRQDNQIKRMGYRMEVGEVEHALQAIPGFTHGCCLYNKETGRLGCFWEGELSREEIVRALKKQLPRYALPDTYIHLEQMPYTATMKLDRVKLRGMLV